MSRSTDCGLWIIISWYLSTAIFSPSLFIVLSFLYLLPVLVCNKTRDPGYPVRDLFFFPDSNGCHLPCTTGRVMLSYFVRWISGERGTNPGQCKGHTA